MSAGESRDPISNRQGQQQEGGQSGDSAQAVRVAVTDDLVGLRHFVAENEATDCLSRDQLSDFVFAVNEAATNALQHARAPRWLSIWRAGAELIGEVSSQGTIGKDLDERQPSPSEPRGRGLWLVRQLCDRVELRTTASRTTIRMHIRCPCP